MGCVTSKHDINDLHPNIFQVSNVDDVGNRLSSGQLEVNDTELVFYQRGKTPVRWPLRSLRRYGYDNQVFSFEAGRRCPTGSGIYSFSCRRAELLFNFVQANVQLRNNEDTVSREVGTPTPVQTRPTSGTHWEPTSNTETIVSNATVTTNSLVSVRQSSLPRLSFYNNPSRLNSVGSSNGCVSPSPPLSTNNNYTNEFFPTEENVTEMLYMNINLGGAPPSEETPIYVNLTPGSIEPMNTVTNALTTNRNVNYIVLDLDNSTEKQNPPPDSPNRPSEGYVTIDFDKTVALSHSVHPTFENEGSRKTRHNSTINELVSSSRQAASLSD